MASFAWILKVRPGYEEEYKRRHDELWPEMDAALRALGVEILPHLPPWTGSDWIFRDRRSGRHDRLSKDDPVNARWSEYMAPIMQIDIDPATGFPFLLPRQWSLD